MFAPLRVIAVAAVLAALGSVASAERLAITNVHGEPDVAIEAGSVTLLVRTALAGTDRTLLEAPTGLTVSAAGPLLEKIGADHAILMELSREGSGLRLTLAIVGDKDPDVSLVRAGDGDIQALAKGAVDRITTVLKLEPGRVPPMSLGRLRPFVSAMMLREKDPAAAAQFLADATPSTVLAAPAAALALHGLPGVLTDRTLAVLSARAIGDAAALDAIAALPPPSDEGSAGSAATGSAATAPRPKQKASTPPPIDPIPFAARAFAAVARTNLRAADAEVPAKPPKSGMMTLVTATLAELHADDKRLNDLLIEGATGDQQRAILALGSTIVPARLGAATHRALLGAAEKAAIASPGVVSHIGLSAAEAGVDVPRGLALVTIRELDDAEIRRLEPLIAQGDDPTLLRLRAELAMRRHADTEAAAITAYLAAAANDPRAHRYEGWLLMTQNRAADAAAEFALAGDKREQSRALLVAGDIKGALAAIEGAPTTAEELVIQSRAQLADGRLDLANGSLGIAESVAPVSPFVQSAIIDVSVKRNDPTRAQLAKMLVEKGSGKIVTTKIATAPANQITESVKQLGSGAEDKPAAAPVDLEIDPKQIEPMLARLGFDKLPNKKLVIAEIPVGSSVFSLRVTRSALIRDALAKLLAAAPYKLQVTVEPKPLPSTVDAPTLAQAIGDADAVLVYRVERKGADAELDLLLYMRGATEAHQVANVVSIPGLVVWNTGKILTIAIALFVLIGGVILYLTRSLGTVKIAIEKAGDVADEVLCIDIAKTEVRPPIPDLHAFYTATKKVGSVTKKRSGTLIANGAKFVVPVGTWYVHLYGVYARGGKLRPVPDACTQKIELKRGMQVETKFDLTSKNAEVTVKVEVEPAKGVAVWVEGGQKHYTDAAGEVLLDLAVGNYTLNVDAHGVSVSKPLQVLAPKVQLFTINIKRELRFMNDVELDTRSAEGAVLELAPETGKAARAAKDAKAAKAKAVKTLEGGPNTAIVPHETAVLGAQPYGETAAPSLESQVAAGSRPAHAAGSQPAAGDLLLGRYRIRAELGRGAMGVVHHAWDEKLEREVAIKEMADDLRTIPEAMQLFTQEAKALAQLNHTNIVGMYDQVTELNKVYMIMEFVDGKPLEALVRARGSLPWMEAVGIIDQVCTGLAYAHARKVIHRDIKPANIFVGRDKSVKIGDFGLARVMREMTIRKTEIRGTPLYMAPEQIMGTNVDHRADLYAVGCTLFELCCGRPPFIEGDILFAQLNKQPPVPSSLKPDLPKALDDLILALISKNADDRPGSANEVRTTFRELSNF